MEEKETKKTDSRKFVVWLTWLVITVLVIAWCAVVMIATKQIVDSLVSLAEKTLAWFFAISMMYLGVNVGQKVGLAFAEKLLKQEDKDVEDTVEPGLFDAEAKEDHPQRIDRAAGNQPDCKSPAERVDHRADREQSAPADQKIAAGGKDGIAVKVDRREGHAHRCGGDQQHGQNQRQHRTLAPQPGQKDRRIGAENQRIDRAMVEHLQYLFGALMP